MGDGRVHGKSGRTASAAPGNDHPLTMPPTLRRSLLDVHGPAAEAWLDDLPRLLADVAARWRLTLRPPFTPLTYAYVAPGTRIDGTAVVVKAAPPGPGLRAERAALDAFDGRGAVALIDADEARGVLLLRRIRPGTPLLALVEDGRDEAATRAAAAVMRALHRPFGDPSGHPFPTVADWALGFGRLRRTFDGGTGPLAERLVAMAETAYADLLASPASSSPAAPSPRVLLHGDLHPGNVLASTGGRREGGGGQGDHGTDGDGGDAPAWLAIDPQGVIGEPAYEAGAWLRNPLPWLLGGGERRARSISARRVAILAEALGVERERIAAWGAAQAVLSAWWSIEDHGAGWEGAMEVAEVLFSIVGDGPHQATETPRSATPTPNP